METHKASEGHLCVRGFVLGNLDLLAVSWAWWWLGLRCSC